MKLFLFLTLQHKVILVLLLFMNLPFFLAGYMAKGITEKALLEEKRDKLLALANILDARLGSGGYRAIFREHGADNAPRDVKIKLLNQELGPATDEVGKSAPGLGVGYYSRDLDAIVTYGPSDKFAYAVGLSIPPDHPGRIVMRENRPLVESGTMVRGDIMNAMIPIDRDGEVIGYIWSNELTTDIAMQFGRRTNSILFVMAFCFCLTFFAAVLLSRRTVRDVERITKGLRDLRFDLTRRIRVSGGDLGEIADSINDMAADLVDARTMSENLISSMDNGMVAVDTKGLLKVINPSAQKSFDLTARRSIGRPCEEVFGPGPFTDALMETLRKGILHVLHEIECPLPGGSVILTVTSSLLRNSNHEVIGAMLTFRDVTEKKHLEEQVQRADRLATLGELMAGVAHEIRNPLTSIKGFLQYFQGADVLIARETYIPLMLREVDRMNRIIDALLFFSRPCETLHSSVRLADLLQETLVLVRNQAGGKAIDFSLSIPENLPRLTLDVEQFKQVFLNLLINSMQAMSGKGTIRISARRLPKQKAVELCFADTGPGIPPDKREDIFDPFYTTKQTGTGLGLAVAHRIITAQGGSIEALDAPGGGALMRLVIPLSPEGSGT